MRTRQPQDLANGKHGPTVPGHAFFPDVRAALTADHEELARSLQRLVDFVKASDSTAARDEWAAFEPGVLRHLDAEEMYLLPAFERADAVEASAIGDEHVQIRRMLGEIGLAFELHLVRLEHIERLQQALVKHVARETESVYTWASTDRNHFLARSMLRRIGRPLPASPDDAAVSILVGLVQACRDGERGYSHAAKDTDDEGYRVIFERYARERASFADALVRPLQRFGASAELSGTLLGAVHREWLDASATLARGNPRAILKECERGDAAAMRLYAAAMHAGLPPDVQEIVQAQHDSLRSAQTEIHALSAMEKR